MIPKIIHYCWFGGKPLDKLGEKCLASWKKYFPDYEIIEWNENNFDVNCCQYVKEAYEEKKWAFVSDYARFKILYEHGGVYFDTDVEVIKPFDDILENGNFMGIENNVFNVAPGLGIAVAPGLAIIKELIDDYEQSSFYKKNGSLNLYTIVERTTDILKKHGLKNTQEIQNIAELNIYPKEYFNPIDRDTGKLIVTEKSHSIHWYAASWEKKSNILRGKIYRFINRYFGENIANYIRKIFGKNR